MSVKASELATELKISTSHLLVVADKTIDTEFQRGGLEAIRGWSVKYRSNGTAMVSEPLAAKLREGKT